MTKIHGQKYTPLSSVFENEKDITTWSMEGLFIACLGLCFRNVSDENLALYNDIIHRFELNTARIKKLDSDFPKKFSTNL